MGLEAKGKESRDTCRIRRINKSKRLEMQRFYCFFKGGKNLLILPEFFYSSLIQLCRERETNKRFALMAIICG